MSHPPDPHRPTEPQARPPADEPAAASEPATVIDITVAEAPVWKAAAAAPDHAAGLVQAAPVQAEIAQAPPAQPPGNGLPPGTRLGEFEITALLGEGGFGIVYRALDHSLQRQVALKEYMPATLASRAGGTQVQVRSERERETFEAGRRSFINEARLLARFDHPALVKVYRFWEDNGTAYMVMPFYEGRTLAAVLQDLGQAPDETWLRQLLGPLTEALAVIHAENCFHRDIAPDNILMLSGSLRPVLLDFGAARRVIGDRTQALTVILKPGYAPVEQYADIPSMKQGAWTDLYALAAVVHRAILGRTPPPSVGRLLNDTYVPLVQAAAGRCSDSFLAAIDRALAVRPADRTASIAQLRNELGLQAASFDPYITRPLPVVPEAEGPGGATFADGAAGAAADTPVRAEPAAPLPRPAAPEPAPASATARALAPAHPGPAGAPTADGADPARGSARLRPPAARGRSRGLVLGSLGACAAAGVVYVLQSGTAPTGPAPASGPGASQPAAPTARPAAEPSPGAQALPAQASAAAAMPVAPSPAPFDPSAELARVVQAQSPGWAVQVQTSQPQYRIGRDGLRFTVSSRTAGHVQVLLHGADGQLLQLWPNARQPVLQVQAGQPLSLPPPGTVLQAQGPAGWAELLVMVSAQPRDHPALQPQDQQDYLLFPGGAQAAARAAAAATGPQPLLAGQAACAGQADCDERFGAALVRVQAVP